MIGIVGQVGCGKSVLLQTILGETQAQSGWANVIGRVSYYSQVPWIFQASVRQNILFGQEMNISRYREVLRCCQLEVDLKRFPHGDQTLIGERGVSLSGGQKARISLARCVYKDADIYLLDDPLSAVDTIVAKKLMDECVHTYLSSKTVVLVTHQTQHLTLANKIYVMDTGKVNKMHLKII